MALTKQQMALTSGLYKIEDSSVNATAVNDVLTGAATLYWAKISNVLNSSAVYFKMWNAAAPTVGTTAPDKIIPVAAYKTVTVGCLEGVAFGTGLSYACVTTAGTAGTTNPTNAVTLEMVVA